MKTLQHAAFAVAALLATADSAKCQSVRPGTQEFGLTEKELVQAVEKVEGLIAQCMREQGFEYVAVDYKTVRNGMASVMTLPGVKEEEFIATYGYGIATLYSGESPQLSKGYSPAKIGLGERNVQIYKNLSPADQAAYNRALLGENLDATFAVCLDLEDFSRCGGCTRKAVAQVFKPEQLKSGYINPKDALIAKDPRMTAALRKFADEMHKAGYQYSHPDEVETDIGNRLHAIVGGGSVPIEKLLPDQRAGLKKLQDDERRIAKLNLQLKEKLLDPVTAQIEKELFPREDK